MLVLVDVETFGLDQVNDHILELGLMIVDADTFEVRESRAWLFPSLINQLRAHKLRYDYMQGLIPKDDPNFWVAQTHTENRLFDAICDNTGAGNRSLNMDVMASEIADWLTTLLKGLSDDPILYAPPPMCGSSVQFDRGVLANQMPALEAAFHYRNEDISSLKNFVKRWMPGVTTLASTALVPAKAHRVLSDLGDSLDELKFYKKHVFDRALADWQNPGEAQWPNDLVMPWA